MLERLGIRARLVFASALLTLLAGLVLERLTSQELEVAMMTRVRSDLALRISLVEDAVAVAGAQNAPNADWSNIAHSVAARAGARVTLIAASGEVVGDSEVPAGELHNLENHAGRVEIAQALEHGEGSAIRESVSLHVRMIYVARRYGAPPSGPRSRPPRVSARRARRCRGEFSTIHCHRYGRRIGDRRAALWFWGARDHRADSSAHRICARHGGRRSRRPRTGSWG